MKTACDELEVKYPGTVILQLRGMFYNAFGDSAVVLSSVTGYKAKKLKSGRFECGFPASALEKNIEILKSEDIGFRIFANGEEQYGYDGDKEKYHETVERYNPPAAEIKKFSVTKDECKEFTSLTFNCPVVLAEQLERFVTANWLYSKDAIISELIKKGLGKYNG